MGIIFCYHRIGVSFGDAPYERSALSKGYLLPETRLLAFHTCVGANEERLTPEWYKEHVMSADVKRRILLTTIGETTSYNILIIATGAQVLKLEEFGVSGSDAENVCYLQDLVDANRLVNAMQSCTRMERAASLVINKLNVTMVFPEAHCMARLFTPKIASCCYEDDFVSRGLKLIKGTVLSSFDFDSNGKVFSFFQLPADMVVVGIGIRPNTGLFEGQLTLEKGVIKVSGRMQRSNSSVYAVEDVAAFPVKLFGETLPTIFYSRVFTLSWQFYGDNAGEVVHFGDDSGKTMEVYWINKDQLVGSVFEGGTKEEYEAIAKATRLRPAVEELSEVERQGPGFALTISKQLQKTIVLDKPFVNAWHATAALIVVASVAAFAYCYGRRR
ncbi:hypothetical protein K2173_014162 [Erythroxylum novogranatense]|uniref:monodehydroascorbate reductase (NADH) n=1 Tax=Erythroxylum novogranatense TaxID=1862640 RepID=A0AAV8SDE5_9ROSI|nr:hypothetical protein K2173_014162 [Erythroxylum novogranatense]